MLCDKRETVGRNVEEGQLVGKDGDSERSGTKSEERDGYVLGETAGTVRVEAETKGEEADTRGRASYCRERGRYIGGSVGRDRNRGMRQRQWAKAKIK